MITESARKCRGGRPHHRLSAASRCFARLSTTLGRHARENNSLVRSARQKSTGKPHQSVRHSQLELKWVKQFSRGVHLLVFTLLVLVRSPHFISLSLSLSVFDSRLFIISFAIFQEFFLRRLTLRLILFIYFFIFSSFLFCFVNLIRIIMKYLEIIEFSDF